MRKQSSTRWCLGGIVLIIAMFAVGACGDSDSDNATVPTGDGAASTFAGESTTSPAVSGDACALVTADEAAELLGGAVSEPSSGSAQGVDTCTYTRDPATAGILSITLTSNLSYYDAQKANLPNPEPVDGVGDEAVWDGTVDQLLVRAGDHALGLTWGGDGIEATKDAAVALAQQALNRM